MEEFACISMATTRNWRLPCFPLANKPQWKCIAVITLDMVDFRSLKLQERRDEIWDLPYSPMGISEARFSWWKFPYLFTLFPRSPPAERKEPRPALRASLSACLSTMRVEFEMALPEAAESRDPKNLNWLCVLETFQINYVFLC